MHIFIVKNTQTSLFSSGKLCYTAHRKQGRQNLKVFLCENIHPEALALLKTRAEIISDWDNIAEAEAIINRNLRLPAELLSKMPQLRAIAVHGTGHDGIDMDYCREKSITVFYVPFENADSVAELILAFSLALLRKLPLADRLLLSGEIRETAPAVLFGNELMGKTVAFLGVGDIARRAARIFREGFRANVIGYAPSFTKEKAEKWQIGYTESLSELLSRADILSIGVHLTPETKGMISENELSQMKSSAILINTARGTVIDEKALYKALKEKKIAAAACDVFENEPPTLGNPLLSLENFLATPHIGANTDEALRRVGI